MPVWFREEPFGPQQRLFYTLEALGLVPTLHRKVFQTIHGERTRLRTAEDMAAFALKNGVDPMAFMTAYNSFGVQTKSQQARQTASAYKIDAVPAMGVAGPLLHQRQPRQRRLAARRPNDRMLGGRRRARRQGPAEQPAPRSAPVRHARGAGSTD